MNNKNIDINGAKILRLGLGMSKLGSQSYNSHDYVKQRLSILDSISELGKIFLDTAPLYGAGFSELILGSYLKKKRNNFFLATKFFPSEADSVAQTIEKIKMSLKRLQSDYVDLLQIHWPNALIEDEFLLEMLEEIKNQSLCSNLGTCNYSAKGIDRLIQKKPNLILATNQIEFNLMTHALHDKAKIRKAKSIQVAYGILNQGRMAYSEQQLNFLKSIADNRNCKLETVVLAWCLSYKNIIPLTKVSSLDHLIPLLEAFDHVLSQGEIDKLEGFSTYAVKLLNSDAIELISDGYRQPYTTVSEAYENKIDLIPSPYSLAQKFLDDKTIIPIKVYSKSNGKYSIAEYDPIGDSKIYWAWRIAFPQKKIPVYIINE